MCDIILVHLIVVGYKCFSIKIIYKTINLKIFYKQFRSGISIPLGGLDGDPSFQKLLLISYENDI
jgi:hypothetical protein